MERHELLALIDRAAREGWAELDLRIGQSGVGKTLLVNRLLDETYDPHSNKTEGEVGHPAIDQFECLNETGGMEMIRLGRKQLWELDLARVLSPRLVKLGVTTQPPSFRATGRSAATEGSRGISMPRPFSPLQAEIPRLAALARNDTSQGA
jgi:hypothetical protein